MDVRKEMVKDAMVNYFRKGRLRWAEYFEEC